MPRLLVRILAVLAGLALVTRFFGMLAALSLGFSREAPLPREAATVLLVVSAFGTVMCGVTVWWLNRKLDEVARAEERPPRRR